MIYEVANALRYHPAIGSDRVTDRIGDVFALDIGLDPASETALTAAIRTAYRKGLSLTEASYIALAERIDGPVYTADETLLRAAGPRGKHIRSLGASGCVADVALRLPGARARPRMAPRLEVSRPIRLP